jgi:hypothetical protein
VHDFEAQSGRDSLLRLARQLAALPPRGSDRRCENHFRAHLALRDQLQNRLQQRHVPVIGGIDVHGTVRLNVAHCRRMQRRAEGHRGLQQRRVKMMDESTVARGALWKNGNPVSLRQRRAHDLVQATGVAPAGAFDKKRSGTLAENPHERPASNFRFRNEPRRAHDVDHEDVEPGDVVGNQQRWSRAVERRHALRVDPQIKNGQRASAPPLHHPEPGEVRKEWIDAKHPDEPVQEEEQKSREAPAADRKRRSSGAHPFRKCFR